MTPRGHVTLGRPTGMKRMLLAFTVLSALALANVAAAGTGALSIEKVTAQTRDGGAWQPGQPVLVVFDVRLGDAASFPDSGLAVVMQAQKERTKCLDVPLRKVSDAGGVARYAGIFYPFYEATFDGLVSFGDGPTQDFTFRIDAAIAPSDVARDANVPSADPLAAAPPSRAENLAAATPVALAVLLLALLPVLPTLRRRLA